MYTNCGYRCGWWMGLVVLKLLLLLVLHIAHSQTLSGNKNVIENEYDNDNLYNYENSSNRNDNERNSFIRTFRFHDFAPRSLNEPTWPTLIGPLTGSVDKMFESEQSNDKQTKSVSEKRKKIRGLHFEANDKELAVNLEFVIPFIRVPVTRTIDITKYAFRKLVDLNSKTLLLGGSFAIAAALIVGVVKTIRAPTFYGYDYTRKKAEGVTNFMDDLNFVSYIPRDDEEITTTESVRNGKSILNTLEQSLYSNNINLTACTQLAICSYLQRATRVVQAGKGSPAERIIDGLANLDVLNVYLNGTAIMDAIDSGRQTDAGTCDLIYSSCQWTNLKNKVMDVAMEYFTSNFWKL